MSENKPTNNPADTDDEVTEQVEDSSYEFKERGGNPMDADRLSAVKVNLAEEDEDEILHYQVPGYDHEFYANHNPSFENLSAAKSESGEGFSDRDAEMFAMNQGLEAAIREKAHLEVQIKQANKAKLMAMLVTCLLCILLVAMLTAFSYYPKRTYIATMDNTAVCSVNPQDNPNITDSTITEFAKNAVSTLYTIDYINYPTQIEQTMTRYFTSQGRVDQVAAFQASGILDTLSNRALTLRASTRNAPRIEEKGLTSDGKPYWVVRFPMVIDVYSGSTTPKETQRHLVTVRLRADTASAANPTGLGILAVAMVPDTSN
ncbi:DotI/IcmL family type IV secretion protein [Moraxella sp. ZJ142]|uniref:DotI/IcmL family type IV secretion protein n=1 Tax=Moraxella marmotae TaxID=3344520 RepID=UPI0035D48269